MNTTNTLAITAISCSFLAIIFIGFYLYHSQRTIKNELKNPGISILNTFPSELNQTSQSSILMISSILATCFSFLGFALFFSAMFCSSFANTNGTFSIKSATYFAIAICLLNCATMYTTTCMGYNKSVKLPIILNVLFIVSSFCIGIIFPLIVNAEAEQYSVYTLNQVIGWIGFALGMLGAIPLLNPKLMDWYKMEKTEVDGTTVYVRPKVNHLATYIWGCFVLVCLLHILLIINSFVMIFE